MRKLRLIIGLCAIVAIFAAEQTLDAALRSAQIEKILVSGIPVTVFRPVGMPPGPAVVIAHGFAGSRQMMQPLALTLARSGFTAVTFDFAGHGANVTPMPGGLTNLERSTQALLDEIRKVVAFARRLEGARRGVALAGHSMGADLVVKYAMQDRDIAATVAFSLFGGEVKRDSPRNLLVIDGAWEPAALVDAGRRIVGQVSGTPPKSNVIYGDFATGSARKLVLAAGAEHIGVIYSQDGLTAARDWMNAVFGRDVAGAIDRRGSWLALLFAGLVALAWSLSALLPRVRETARGAGLGWRRLLPLAVAPAILTPLILWKMPTSFLPILLGDYLTIHLLVYGLITGAAVWRLRERRLEPRTLQSTRQTTHIEGGATAIALYMILAIGRPLDSYVTSFTPGGLRWVLMPVVFVGAAIYFLADEWMTRGAGAARGGYVFTKVCFVASLLAAVPLNPQKLFFLVIITPVMVIFFVVFGLFSAWAYRATLDPRVAALGNAAALAFAVSVTFPIVGG